MSQLSRREFVAAAAATCACALHPEQLLALAEKSGPVSVGTLADFPHDGVYDQWARTNGFFVIRQQERLYATSNACTHKITAKLVSQQGQLVCPKHGSRFTLAGEVARGPARRALPRYAIAQAADGKLTVDPSRQYAEGQWDRAGSYVSVR